MLRKGRDPISPNAKKPHFRGSELQLRHKKPARRAYLLRCLPAQCKALVLTLFNLSCSRKAKAPGNLQERGPSGRQKKIGGPAFRRSAHFYWLEAGDVRCLQAFFRDRGLLRTQPPGLRSAICTLPAPESPEKWTNIVLAGLALDESESLAGIEPLDCSLFSSLMCFPSLISYLCYSTASSRKTETGRKLVELAGASFESKGVTRATNAPAYKPSMLLPGHQTNFWWRFD